MTVYTNISAIKSYNDLTQRQLEAKKNLARVASGMKINGAKDAPSDYAISEKMRTMIRSLEMNKQNIKNGSSLMTIAAEAVGNQVEIMKKAKEIALKATDGTYSNLDRRALQGELDQLLDQSEEIAITTNYNGIPLLMGGNYLKTKVFYNDLDAPVQIVGSEMGIIPGGWQNYSKYKDGNVELDFSGKTVDDLLNLKGTSFYLNYDADGDGTINPSNEIYSKYIFLEDGAVAPEGFIGITLNAGDKDGLLRQIANGIYSGSVNKTTVDGDKIVVEAYPGYDHSKLSFGPGASVNPSKLDGTDSYSNLQLSGGATDSPIQSFFDFGRFDTADKINDLLGKGIRVGDYTLVFADSSAGTSNYPANSYVVDINGYQTWPNKAELLAEKVANVIGNDYSSGIFGFKASAPGAKVEITTNLGGTQSIGAGNSVPPKPGYGATGLFSSGTSLSGGVTEKPPQDNDDVGVAGQKASITLNGLPTAGTGFVIQDQQYSGNPAWEVMFVAGNHGSGNQIAVGELVEGFSREIGNYIFSVSGGKMNITYKNEGSGGNRTYLYDSIPGHAGVEGSGGISGIDGKVLSGTHASFDTNITDATIRDLAGTAFKFSDTSYRSDYYGSGKEVTYEFYDSGSTDVKKQSPSIPGAVAIDINGVTTLFDLASKLNAVDTDPSKDGGTCADKYGTGTSAIEDRFTVSGGKLKILAKHAGLAGNGSKLYPISMKATNDLTTNFSKGDNSHYTIDFGKWFDDNRAKIDEAGSVAEFLTGKGFRADCATCDNEWINIEFVTDLANANPASYNYPIDVSGVQTAEDLVRAIYGQTEDSGKMNHFTHIRMEDKDPITGDPIPPTKLTLFDNRNFDTSDRGIGAVRDGIMSDRIPYDIDLYYQEIPIQEWTKSNQIIQLKIPRTTLDHLIGMPRDFLYLESTKAANRTLDAVDNAIDYLLESATMIGAQQSRLTYAHNNVVTASENMTDSESTYRDADMAKELTGLAKNNTLSQTAQASLKYALQKNDWVIHFLGDK